MKAFNPNMSDPDVQRMYHILHNAFVAPIEKAAKASIASVVQQTDQHVDINQVVQMCIALSFLQCAIEMIRAENKEDGVSEQILEFRRLLGIVLPKYEVDVSSIESPTGGRFTLRRGGRHRDNGSEST